MTSVTARRDNPRGVKDKLIRGKQAIAQRKTYVDIATTQDLLSRIRRIRWNGNENSAEISGFSGIAPHLLLSCLRSFLGYLL